MNDSMSEAAELLARTLEEGLFKIVYQPIVDLKKRATYAYEALVRPQLFKSPPEMIDVAVQQGRVGELGRAMRVATIANCNDHALFVNIHPNCLHLFACVDGWPLPEFSGVLPTGARAI